MTNQNASDELHARPEALTAFETKFLSLLALMLVNERQQTDQISLLSRAGFRPSEIASLIDTTPNTVSVVLSKQKRIRRKAKGKSKGD
jgi:hypothetical protein